MRAGFLGHMAIQVPNLKNVLENWLIPDLAEAVLLDHAHRQAQVILSPFAR